MDTLMLSRCLALLLTVMAPLAKSQTKQPILCATGTFTEGSLGFIECLFNRNINTTDSRYNFNVVHFPTSNQSKTISGNRVLLCNWRQDELECKTGDVDGYSFDNKVSDRLTVEIKAVSEKHAGLYSCQVVPGDDIPVEPCTLSVKAMITTTSQPRTTYQQNGAESNSPSAVVGLVIALVVCLVVIVPTGSIVLVYYIRRKAWPSSMRDIIDFVSCCSSRQNANLAGSGGVYNVVRSDSGAATAVDITAEEQPDRPLMVKEESGVDNWTFDVAQEWMRDKIKELSQKLAEEKKVLTEKYNRERVLRKKYYNMIKDMKGEIRVYCRVRPMIPEERTRGNVSVVKSPDEYSITVQTATSGLKKFQFDQVFMPESTQEEVFEDTNHLIQSAVDGYNVCIFAYGQTGSGKTFTIIGDQAGRFPGIAPRAFQRIFQLADENKGKIKMTVTAYMLELYNEKLIDLFTGPDLKDKLKIKQDKKGMVFIQGAVVKPASNAEELTALFEEGFKSRHSAPTEMNAESSRSHLIVGVVMESTDMATGKVVKGKLSLVDLAGSERFDKTPGASPETAKEAKSINTSLSALSSVILALSRKQKHIPYRDSTLTMLMQDSLGGNAKTLMFVNISPTNYDAEETVASLEYCVPHETKWR